MSETRTAAPFVNNNREHLRDEFTQTLKKIAKEFKTPIVLEKNWFKKWRQEKQSQQTYRSAKILKKHFSLYAPPEQRLVIINKALQGKLAGVRMYQRFYLFRIPILNIKVGKFGNNKLYEWASNTKKELELQKIKAEYKSENLILATLTRDLEQYKKKFNIDASLKNPLKKYKAKKLYHSAEKLKQYCRACKSPESYLKVLDKAKKGQLPGVKLTENFYLFKFPVLGSIGKLGKNELYTWANTTCEKIQNIQMNTKMTENTSSKKVEIYLGTPKTQNLFNEINTKINTYTQKKMGFYKKIKKTKKYFAQISDDIEQQIQKRHQCDTKHWLYQTEHKLCDVITKTNKAKESLNFLLLQVENQQANIKSHLNKFEDFQEKTNIKLKHDLYYQKSLSVVKKHKRFLKKQENSIHEIKDNFMKKLNKLSEIHKREKLIYRAKECTGELEGLINSDSIKNIEKKCTFIENEILSLLKNDIGINEAVEKMTQDIISPSKITADEFDQLNRLIDSIKLIHHFGIQYLEHDSVLAKYLSYEHVINFFEDDIPQTEFGMELLLYSHPIFYNLFSALIQLNELSAQITSIYKYLMYHANKYNKKIHSLKNIKNELCELHGNDIYILLNRIDALIANTQIAKLRKNITKIAADITAPFTQGFTKFSQENQIAKPAPLWTSNQNYIAKQKKSPRGEHLQHLMKRCFNEIKIAVHTLISELEDDNNNVIDNFKQQYVMLYPYDELAENSCLKLIELLRLTKQLKNDKLNWAYANNPTIKTLHQYRYDILTLEANKEIKFLTTIINEKIEQLFKDAFDYLDKREQNRLTVDNHIEIEEEQTSKIFDEMYKLQDEVDASHNTVMPNNHTPDTLPAKKDKVLPDNIPDLSMTILKRSAAVEKVALEKLNETPPESILATVLSLCCLVHEKAQRAHLATFLNLYYKDLEKEKQYQPSRYIFFSPKKIPSPNALKKVINACCLAPKKENLLLRIVRCTSLPTPYSFYANPTKKTQNSPTLEKKLLGIIK